MQIQTVIPVFVSWNTLRWMPIGLGSFRQYFPSWRILVVDNNPHPGEADFQVEHETERNWLRAQPGVRVISGSPENRSHGRAMDIAAEWCRQEGADFLLHLEPDCLISGTRWYEELCRCIDSGAWMAGSHRKQYGPIHVTPSLWKLSQLNTSFEVCDRAPDEGHPRFLELFDKDWLIRAVFETDSHVRFWQTKWDTGQRAWFQCAVADKACQAEETNDFRHFWFGANQSLAKDQIRSEPKLQQYQPNDPLLFHASATGAPVSELTTRLGSLLTDAVQNLKVKRVVYAGCPRHANTGDLLLMAGNMAAMRTAGLEIAGRFNWPDCPPRNLDADMILLHGGGNFGDLYPDEMNFRIRVCEELRDHRIVWLPQSVQYCDSARTSADLARLQGCDHVEFWFRDAYSLHRAAQLGLQKIRLVPDGLFGLQQTPARFAVGGERRLIRRTDQESTSDSSPETDWLLPGQTMLHGINEAWDQARRLLDGVRMVITDRLHAHLVCVISDIPNVLVADRFGKNLATYQTWTHLHARSRFACNWNEADRLEAELNSGQDEESGP